MHTLFDFTTSVKAVEYLIAIAAIASFILFWEFLKDRPFKTLMDTGREDIKYVKEHGFSLRTLVSAPLAGIVYVISLPFAFVVGLAAALMNGLMQMGGGSAVFSWRPLEAYLSGKKARKAGVDRSKQTGRK